jgi:hypothetical protein
VNLILFIVFTDKPVHRRGIYTAFQTKRHEIKATDLQSARELAVAAHPGSTVSMSWSAFPQPK